MGSIMLRSEAREWYLWTVYGWMVSLKLHENRPLVFGECQLKPQFILILSLAGEGRNHALHYESACLWFPVGSPTWRSLGQVEG
jgi:hypothetical protein